MNSGPVYVTVQYSVNEQVLFYWDTQSLLMKPRITLTCFAIDTELVQLVLVLKE